MLRWFRDGSLVSNEQSGFVTTRTEISGCRTIDTCGILEVELTPQHNGAVYKCEATQHQLGISKNAEVTLEVFIVLF